MSTFKNLSDLKKFVDVKVKESLIQDVGKKVKQVMQEHVIEDVYDKYSPSQYQRTGGLVRDIEITSTDDGVIITPTREDEGVYIPSIIESGLGYSWTDSEIYRTQQKRPFVANTRKEILDKSLHSKELKNSLQAKGLDVK